MKITDALTAEHGMLYAQFDHLEAALAAPGSLERVRELAAMLAAALEPHSRLEDDLIFAPLGEGPRTGPLACIHDQHEEIEETLAAVGKVADVHTAAALLREAVWLAREHCLAEEEVAFPLAEERLGEAALLRLGEVWEMRRTPQPA